MRPQILLLSLLFLELAYADLLQNPDFESPPSDLTKDSNSPFVTLKRNNTLPGWTFSGTVQYVSAGDDISLPDNGHAILLGEDGKINQTIAAETDYINYLLTFIVTPGGKDCSDTVGLQISAPDSSGFFTLKKSYGKEAWESYGFYLGSWGDGEPINIVIGSQTTDTNSSSTCWPVVDKLLLKTMGIVALDSGNLIVNGGFEYGPDFLSISTEGLLLDAAPSPMFSPITQWSVAGTVKYIDSKHFFVPQGNAAIEIVSGVSSGIQTAITLKEGSSYDLEFMLGDAKDMCVGDFLVGAQAASTFQNFTLPSNGNGSAKKFSLTFKAGPSPTTINFTSYATTKTKDGVLCGPVIDDVVLRASHGQKIELLWNLLISLFLVSILCFL